MYNVSITLTVHINYNRVSFQSHRFNLIIVMKTVLAIASWVLQKDQIPTWWSTPYGDLLAGLALGRPVARGGSGGSNKPPYRFGKEKHFF